MRLVTSTIDGRWGVRYDAAYRQILEGLGEPVITLAAYREKYKPQASATPAVAGVSQPRAAVAAGPTAVVGTTAAVTDAGSSLVGPILAGGLLAGGGIAVVFMIM